MKRITITALTLLALLVTAAPAGATAFYNNRVLIPEGEVATVAAHAEEGKLKVTLKRPHVTAETTKCSATGVSNAWNEPGFGRLELASISFACEGGWTIATVGGWLGTLEGEVFPLHLALTNVSLHVETATADYGTFTGTMDPVYGDNDPNGGDGEEGLGDELDTEIRFIGTTGNKLVGSGAASVRRGLEVSTVALAGFYHQGPKGEGITAQL
jgi:hypothetical protein